MRKQASLYGILCAALLLIACSTSPSTINKIQLHTPLSCPCPTIAPLANYPLPALVACCIQTGAYIGSMTVGPDGNVWVPELAADMIARVTESGAVTEFAVPTAGAQPYLITPGPDGNLWFTENNFNTIGRVTTAGVVTEFPLPPPLGTSPPNAQGELLGSIAAGPDGNLWFVHPSANVVGVMSTSGSLLTTYPIPTANSEVEFIIKGPDGNMWFNELAGNKIGRLTIASGHIDEFPIPTPNSGSRNLIVGPDNNIWFPELNIGNVAQVTMSGVITEFPMVADPTQHQVRRVGVMPDGSMWIVNAGWGPLMGKGSEIGKFNTAGVETDLWSVAGGPNAITAGPDGSPWFGDQWNAQIVRL
jgi:virginiamycin B lyase